MQFTASLLLAIAPLAALAAPADPPVQRGVLNDPFEAFKLNEFWLYSDYIDGGEVRGIRGLEGPNVTCAAAEASRIWYVTGDLSGQILGSRYYEPGVGPSIPHALEVHTDKIHFTVYNSRGPWTIYDTGDKVNGKCVEDISGRFDCGDIQGLSLFKCVGWAHPYNLLGMN